MGTDRWMRIGRARPRAAPPARSRRRSDADYIVVGSGRGRRDGGGPPGGGRLPRAPARGRRRPEDDDRIHGADARREQPAGRLRRAGVPCAGDRERRHAVGLLRPPLRGSGEAGARSELPRDGRRQDRGRRAVSAGRRARRLHRAQRDDPGLPAQCRLESDRRSDRRCVVAGGEHARLLRAHRALRSPAGRAAAQPRWPESQPAWLERLAADRDDDPGRGGAESRSPDDVRRVGAGGSEGSAVRPHQRRSAGASRQRARSQRLARRVRRRDRAALHPDHHQEPPAGRRARARPRCRETAPRSVEDPAARARHAGAVRCVESRDRRGVSKRRVPVRGPRASQRETGARCGRSLRRAR